MKKLLISVNGKRYEVEVEVLQDDEALDPALVYRPVPPPVVTPSATSPSAGTGSAASRSRATPGGSSAQGPQAAAAGDASMVTSPINGVVLEVPVKAGTEVEENQVLVVLEAMKMKTNISSPQKGRIKAVHVQVGDRIETGQAVLEFA